jgi:hypothetical protein
VFLAIPGAYVDLACAGCWPADAGNTPVFDLLAAEEELEHLRRPVRALENPYLLACVAPWPL